MQFSLRSVLLLIAFVAALLGGWKVFVEPYRLQQAAAEAIGAEGGVCYSRTDHPGWMCALFGADSFRKVVRVELPAPETTVRCVPLLPRFTDLESLSVCGAEFTDKELQTLKELRELRLLSLRGTTVTAEGIAALKRSLPHLVVQFDIQFDDDLHFEMPPQKPFERSFLTRRIESITGSRVRIEAHMYPTFKKTGIKRFVLMSENSQFR